MKIDKNLLREIVREEIEIALSEGTGDAGAANRTQVENFPMVDQAIGSIWAQIQDVYRRLGALEEDRD